MIETIRELAGQHPLAFILLILVGIGAAGLLFIMAVKITKLIVKIIMFLLSLILMLLLVIIALQAASHAAAALTYEPEQPPTQTEPAATPPAQQDPAAQ